MRVSKVAAGALCLVAAAACYVVGWVLTMGKPAEGFYDSPEGQWRYVTAPTALIHVSIALVAAALGLWLWAVVIRFGRTR